MKKENAYKSDYRRADQVGVYIMMRNKLKTIRTYNSRKAFKRLNTPGDFLNAVRGFESESERRKSAAEKAAGLWFLERLIREARIFDNGSFLLAEPVIERFKPILHVGWGMDVLSETGFDFSRFTTVIKHSADPKYKLLVVEPIGIIYAAGQQPLKSLITGINIPPIPDQKSLSAFFAHFSEEETQMISHGYGRGIYFQAYSLCSALKKARDCPVFFDTLYSIKGISFAYTLVNSSHLDKVFLTADKLASSDLGSEETRFFHDGVTSALSFLEWNLPGLLESLEENRYTEKARQIVKSYRASGGVYRF
ncbi:hypothetical protein ACFLRT_03480 [Acidobacteriota bacterium]